MLIGAELRGRNYHEECLVSLSGGLILAAIAIFFLWILPEHLIRFSIIPLIGSTPFSSYYLGLHVLGKPSSGESVYSSYHLALQDDAIGFILLILIPLVFFLGYQALFYCVYECFYRRDVATPFIRNNYRPIPFRHHPLNTMEDNEDDKSVKSELVVVTAVPFEC
jgi:hypothetical protein